MRILYSWLREFIAIKESPEELAELLSSSSFETVVAKRMGADAILEVGLLPNRVADASSHFGIAREIALIKGRKLRLAFRRPAAGSQHIAKQYTLSVSAHTLTRRYMLAAIAGVKVASSPPWLQKRLVACGLRSINNVVDATNYVMLELGQPLHAFDADKIAGRRIFVRPAKKGETIETIERKVYALSGRDVLIADAKGPLALAGVKGGRRAEISPSTKTILIESANFDPLATRETAKRHALKTDASWRFENDLDPNAAEAALYRVLELIKEVAGGAIMAGALDAYPKKVLPIPIVISVKRISRLIGEDIPAPRMVARIAPLCRSVKKIGRDALLLKVEPYRRDVKYFEDVAEEVARLVGYNSIRAIPPVAALLPARKNEAWMFRERLRDELAALGFSETYNYSFIADEHVVASGFGPGALIEVANPISGAYRYLRGMLLPNLLKNVRDNLRFFRDVRVFEIGKTFKTSSGKPAEAWRASGMIGRKGAAPQELFYEAKGVIEALAERFGLDRDDYGFHSGEGHEQDAVVRVGEEEVARIGMVPAHAAYHYDIEAPVAYFDIDTEALMRAVAEEHEFEPLHKYPDVIRDVSILVPAFTKVEEVENVIEGAGAKYLEDTDLFDVYDEGLPGDQISMAFHLIFRSPERTLTDEDVGRDMEKIAEALRRFGAQIR